MTLKVFDHIDDLYAFARDIVLAELTAIPTMTLGLAAGKTPTKLYELLVDAAAKSEKISFKKIKTVNLDEYIGIAPDSPKSFYSYTKSVFTDRVGVAPENAIALNGVAHNIDEECQNYERRIEEFGGIDLQILGLGENGHIGFNEPGSKKDSRTRRVELSEITKKNLSKDFPVEKPTHGVTIGVANVLAAKKIILIATGASKALAVKKSFYEKPNELWPASYCQNHKNFVVLLDLSAASLVTAADEKPLGG